METLKTSIANKIKAIGSSKNRADETHDIQICKKGTPSN